MLINIFIKKKVYDSRLQNKSTGANDHENRKIKGRLTPFARYSVICQGDKRTNNTAMLPNQKSNAAAGYQGPGKIQLLKGAGLLKL